MSSWREVAYALPYLFKAMAFTPLLVFIPSFYAVDYGIPLATVGAILFLTRLSDVITDPLIGWWSDRVRTRFGRRKPFIAAGAPLLALSAWMVFAPPVAVTPLYATIWLAAIYLGFTLMDIPYRAWGAELSQSYDGRTRIAAWREAFGLGSSLVTLAIILIAPKVGLGTTAETLRLLAIVFVCGMPLCLALALLLAPEPVPVERTEAPLSLREGLSALVSNTAYRWLLGGMIVLMGGAVIGASLHLIVMESYFGIRHLFPIVLAAENICGILAAPLWVYLARRLGKHVALGLGTLGMGVFSFPIPLLAQDQGLIYAVIIAVRGMFGGALAILVASMLADVAEHDMARTGKARAGIYFALTGMVAKMGVALGALVGMAVPPLFGFDPASKQNSQASLEALMYTYAWIPMVIMAASSFFFFRYPLTRARLEAERGAAQP